MGKRLVGSALHYRLTRDRAYIEGATPTLRRYVDELGRQIGSSGTGLLGRERYSSDIPDEVLGLHSQATVWQGLWAMSRVWADVGNAELARRCEALAKRLEAGHPAARSRPRSGGSATARSSSRPACSTASRRTAP